MLNDLLSRAADARRAVRREPNPRNFGRAYAAAAECTASATACDCIATRRNLLTAAKQTVEAVRAAQHEGAVLFAPEPPNHYARSERLLYTVDLTLKA